MYGSISAGLADEEVVIDHRYEIFGNLNIKLHERSSSLHSCLCGFDGVLSELQKSPFRSILSEPCVPSQLEGTRLLAKVRLASMPTNAIAKIEWLPGTRSRHRRSIFHY